MMLLAPIKLQVLWAIFEASKGVKDEVEVSHVWRILDLWREEECLDKMMSGTFWNAVKSLSDGRYIQVTGRGLITPRRTAEEFRSDLLNGTLAQSRLGDQTKAIEFMIKFFGSSAVRSVLKEKWPEES